ncbi:hypothetical protein JXA47_13940 [Candidatus Sumerlaeota bacterium]|nr:hypothetical protein [Candidatus Sumerlaeota bacterium]
MLPAQVSEADAAEHAPHLYPVIISSPDSDPQTLSGVEMDWNPPNSLSCRTCHRVTAAEPTPPWSEDLRNFHMELTILHGDLTCGSCHDGDDHAELTMANGEEIGFEDSMRQCAQCHPHEMQSFEIGAHGGMRGHWDLTRGPRERDHCVDCHDAHAPAYPTQMPLFPVRDRFLDEAGADE